MRCRSDDADGHHASRASLVDPDPRLYVAVSAAGCGGSEVVNASAADTQAPAAPAQAPVPLPNKNGSFKFGVLGDFGTGSRQQYELAEQMAKLHGDVQVRDSWSWSATTSTAASGRRTSRPKFEVPYKPLLDAGVKFYASLGNHDAREQRYYKLFNMDGKLYYSFSPHADVRFFMLESTYPEPEQIKWLENELKSSTSKWKIPVFHHPLYSSGDRHGSDLRLRQVLEPLFLQHNVSVVLTGHDHFYERVKPQQGIVYFVVGSGGQLRAGNIDASTGLTARGFDTDLAFMAAEIDGDTMHFNVVSRRGRIVDSGVIQRRQ